jgi:hypothetical protein
MWTAPASKGLALTVGALAVICPACWCGRVRPLAQMACAARVPNRVAAWWLRNGPHGLLRATARPIAISPSLAGTSVAGRYAGVAARSS